MPNILFTSVGRRVELVRAFRRALQRLGVPGRLMATDIDWLAPALQEVDQARLVVGHDHPDYVSQLVQLCREWAVDLLFPLNDGEISKLAEARAELEAVGTRAAVVDPAAAEICGDKWQTMRFFAELGLPVPRTWLPDASADLATMPWPCFVKPRRGSAGVQAFPLRTPSEYQFFTRYVAQGVVQEFLPGPEITSDVICGWQGEVLAVVSRQRIAVRGGEAIKAVTIRDARIEHACYEIARQLPACGPITVQCMLKDEIPHFLEINARLGGGVPLAMAAGVDVPALLLAAATGRRHPGLATEAVTGVYMTRCDESFFLRETHRALFAASDHL